MTQLAQPTGVGFEPKAGGRIATTDSGLVRVPDQISFTPTGIGLGPLEFATPPDSVAVLERLEFLPEVSGDDSWLSAVAIGGVASTAATDEEAPVSRRDVIRASGAILAGAALVGTAVAEDQTYPIAEFELSRNDSAVQLSVFDPLSGTLPRNETLHVDHGDTRLGSFDTLAEHNPDETTVTTGHTGEFRVYAPDSVSYRERMLAWVNGLLAGDETLSFQFELEQPASEYEPGTTLELTTHPAVVEPDVEIDGDETILEVGEMSIPHENQEFGRDRGTYQVRSGALIYEPGTEAPDGTRVTVDVRVDTLANMLDSIRR